MAKDSTIRGGARIGAGRKKKSLENRIIEGVEFLPEKNQINSKEQPKIKSPKSYLTEVQFDGTKTFARQIYRDTYNWLHKKHCAEFVHQVQVETFAQTTARHIQAEMELSAGGLLIGERVNPLVKISLDYLKMAQSLWYQIWQVAKENSVGVGDSANDTMEQILNFNR